MRKYASLEEYRRDAPWERAFALSAERVTLISKRCGSLSTYKRRRWVESKNGLREVPDDWAHRVEVLAYDVAWHIFDWMVVPDPTHICEAWKRIANIEIEHRKSKSFDLHNIDETMTLLSLSCTPTPALLTESLQRAWNEKF